MRPFDHTSGSVLEVDDAKIYYEVIGPADGPALVFLHGGFGTMEDFNGILPKLAGRFRTIGIDSRGQGKSTLGSKALTYQRIADDVRTLIQYLGLKDVTVVGFSDGGIAAYRLAAQHDVGIRKLVTIGARWILRPDDRVRSILGKVTADSWRRKFPETYDLYQKVSPAPDFDRLAKAIVAMWLDASSNGYPGEMIDAITCPTLVVRGDDDHLLSRSDALECVGRIRGARFSNIAFASHAAFQDQPDVFMRGFEQFMEIQDRPGSPINSSPY